MIPVKAIERPRELYISVGDKLVGRLFVFENGRMTAWARNAAGSDSNWRFLESGLRSIRSATNVILRAKGYGNCRSIDVERIGRLP